MPEGYVYLTPQEVEDMGFETVGKRMDDGEVRVRLGTAALSASFTTRGEQGGWQKSHRHLPGLKETYIVQEGWLAVALYNKETGGVELKFYLPGQSFTLEDDDGHNIYLPAGAVIITIKHGEAKDGWLSVPELNEVTRGISERVLLSEMVIRGINLP